MATIHLRGDSISKGWALGGYEDQNQGYVLYPLRSITSTIQMLLDPRYKPIHCHYDGLAIGGVGNSPGVPAADIAAEIALRVANGSIAPGDVVVIEDAGPHGEDPDAYQAAMLALRTAVVGTKAITCVMMTMFDYAPAPVFCQYDRIFGLRSINDAVRAAANATITGAVGTTILLDMNTAMDMWHAATLSSRNVPSMHSDGIHPNVWGQMLIVGEILRRTGLRAAVPSTAPVVNLCAAQWAPLGYAAPNSAWSDGTATAWAEYLLRA